jgi:hypothetical protein
MPSSSNWATLIDDGPFCELWRRRCSVEVARCPLCPPWVGNFSIIVPQEGINAPRLALNQASGRGVTPWPSVEPSKRIDIGGRLAHIKIAPKLAYLTSWPGPPRRTGVRSPAIHPFEALINECTLSFAVVRELLETALEDRTGILNRASDGSEQFQLHTPVPPLDLRLFAEIAPRLHSLAGAYSA